MSGLKHPTTIGVDDPQTQLAIERTSRIGRGAPRIVEHSLRMSPPFAIGCDIDGSGGNACFRVAHGLKRAPHLVIPMRFQSQRANTHAYAAVNVQTAAPISDKNYSYMSAEPGRAIYAIRDRILASNPENFDFDDCWGDILSATASWTGVSANPLDQLFVNVGTVGNPRRVAVEPANALDVGKAFNLIVVFGLANGTQVTSWVYSAVMDGLLDGDDRRIVPTVLAHAAPPIG